MRLSLESISVPTTPPTMAASFSTSSLLRIASASAIKGIPKTIASKRPFTFIRASSTASKSLSPSPTGAAAAAATAAEFSRQPPPHFSDLPLDKAAHLRKNPSALEQLLDDSRARTIAFYDRKALVAPLLKNKTLQEMAADVASQSLSGSKSTIAPHAALPSTFTRDTNSQHAEAPDGGPPAWIPLTWHPRNSDLVESVDQNIGFIFLGLCHSSGAPVFACRLLKLTPKVVELLGEQEANGSNNLSGASSAMSQASLVDIRSQGQKMTSNDAAIYALASGLLSWHSNTQFCSKTGSPTDPDSAGHARRPAQHEKINSPTAADSGGTISSAATKLPSIEKQRRPRAVYPRIDPAVIVAVAYGNWLLLGRKKSWDTNRYSLLAGFSEVGETLEDAVVREVSEESGVVVDRNTIVYHSSQPWPFPQSLMIGFVGEARHRERVAKSERENGGDAPPISGFDIFPLGSPARIAALTVGVKSEEIDAYATPAVLVDEHEIEDARWFHRDWLLENLNILGKNTKTDDNKDHDEDLGRTNREIMGNYSINQPEFRIPGKYALANKLITDWLLGSAYPRGGSNDNCGTISTISPQAAKDEKESSSWSGNSLPDVKIDQGVFKYILLRASSSTGSPSKLLVRGDCRAAYHNHILTACIAEAAKTDPDIVITILGGGRMEYYSHPRSSMEGGDGGEKDHGGEMGSRNGSGQTGVASVYGYSAAFGPAPHEMTAAVLRKWDPFVHVSVSYEGY